jgi:hypothetical protein
MMYSVVLIVSANVRNLGNTLGEQLGRGPNNFSVPLTNVEESSSITHYGCRAYEDQGFIDGLTTLLQGQSLEGVTMSPEDLQAVLGSLTHDVLPDGVKPPHKHFNDVIAVNNLYRILEE